MKKVFFIFLVILVSGACKNFEKEFPDFDYTAGFFPYQSPARTLIFGDYIYDNSNDLNHKFVISVAMGGVYENTRDRKFQIVVDETLCDNILFSDGGDHIFPMPRAWYTLSSNSEIVIPAGKFNGGIEVQLNDAFFNDPDAIKLKYVIPIRLTGSSDVDQLILGNSILTDPDPRIFSDWVAQPKNFTMFAVKYINEYHGVYFRYGTGVLKDPSNAIVKAMEYNDEDYVEDYPTVKLTTTARKQVSFSADFATKGGDPMEGSYKVLLDFDDNNRCAISAPPGSPYTITGTGEFKQNAYKWGNKDRNGIVLTYIVANAAGYSYTANDVLVIRDRTVVMETYTPALPTP